VNAVSRFTDDIVKLNGRLSFRGLPDAIHGTPLYYVDDMGDGLITMSVRDDQIPIRYMNGILGFRLAQYLRLGLIDNELVYKGAMYHEPRSKALKAVQNLHTITLDGRTGRILGYVGLVCSLDPTPMPLDSPQRSRFPTEVAHHVDVVSRFAAPDLHSHQVYEIKRFVREQQMERGPQRSRVPWHLILGMFKAGVALGQVRVVLGDSKENGALRHVRLMGMDPVVIDQTAPSLPRSELMWPSYMQKTLAKPFAARVPEQLGVMTAGFEQMLRQHAAAASERSLLTELAQAAPVAAFAA
jgi:hypothetical protein